MQQVIIMIQGEDENLGFKDIGCANGFLNLMTKKSIEKGEIDLKYKITMNWREKQLCKEFAFSYVCNEVVEDSSELIQDHLVKCYIGMTWELKNESDQMKVDRLKESINGLKRLLLILKTNDFMY